MPWLDGDDLLNKPYDLPEYRQHTTGVTIASFVYLQVDVAEAYGIIETEWAAERARRDPRLQAIVAYAPLEYGERARLYLERLIKVSPLVKGIRRLYQQESVDFCLQPAFVRGVQLLADFGLSFDICIRHQHLENTVRLVEQCPNVAFVLDHIGKPDIVHQGLDPWRRGMRALASLPNVMCKVSGMASEADRQHWTPADLQPFLEHTLEVFGEDRVLFGGDWPVVLLGAPYMRWVHTVELLTGLLSDAAKYKLWADNARRFYRLPSL
jgi:L-fuconolactonase